MAGAAARFVYDDLWAISIVIVIVVARLLPNLAVVQFVDFLVTPALEFAAHVRPNGRIAGRGCLCRSLCRLAGGRELNWRLCDIRRGLDRCLQRASGAIALAVLTVSIQVLNCIAQQSLFNVNRAKRGTQVVSKGIGCVAALPACDGSPTI